MANSLNSCPLREWAPLTELLNKLPSKQNLSFFSGDVKMTCVDVLPEFIALGTNYGVAYWYDRQKNEMQRLRCENSNIPITSIKVLCSVEYMLACGSNSGNVSIFQIPKSFPDGIPENLKPKNTKVERYTVSELHETQITALEWSKNGMKLFSGDKNGTIVLTEIDFQMHICKSLEILNESYQVVQLSYNHPKLIVSTLYRSIICEKTDKWNVVQIGQKDRKILGTFGGIIKKNGLKSKEYLVYCTRPGLRIWVSDYEGNVQKTLLFKDLLNKDCTEVPLLNPIAKTSTKDLNFGKILLFGDSSIITYNDYQIYILDPFKMEIISKITGLRKVLDIASNGDEIFILETDRNLIRISNKPDVFLSNSTKIFANVKIEEAFPLQINEYTDDEIIVNAEEATENIDNSKLEMKEIDSVDIIYKEKRRKKKKNRIFNFDNISKPTLMNLSTIIDDELHPDLRSPQTIQHDIEMKEKLLADVLQFNEKIKNESESDSQKAVIKEPIRKFEISSTKITRQKTMDEISGKSKSIPIKSNEMPACIDIPYEWTLAPIKLKNGSSESSDLSSDWELL